ncbi:MAG: hypothetical protein ACIAS6_08070 [Phycisphaerales bacterium JB060]
MSTVPRKGADAIPWVKAHVTPWTTNAEQLKLSPTDITALDAQADLAESRRVTMEAAWDAWRAAVASYNQAVKDLRTQAGGQVSIIRSTARTSANPTTIYTLAAIPAPADRTPRPAPGVATDFKTSLLQGGSITLTFRCPNPPRTGPVTYRVERRLVPPAGSPGPFEFYKNAKERTFTDDSIPRGTAQVDYRITAQTSTRDGDPALFGVQFGSGNQATVVQVGGAGKKVA